MRPPTDMCGACRQVRTSSDPSRTLNDCDDVVAAKRPDVHQDDPEVRHGERAGLSAGPYEGPGPGEEDGPPASQVGNEVRGHHRGIPGI